MTAPRVAAASARGQATLEVLAGVPLLVLAAGVALQLLATGYALHLADGAAEAGALALAADRAPAPVARAALPGWARGAVDVESAGGRVRVSLRPPAPAAAISEALEVSSTAWARTGSPDG